MTEELDSFADAAAAALAELEEATPSDDEPSTPEEESDASADDGQAEADESEQAESQPEDTEGDAGDDTSDEDEDSLFADLEDDEDEPEIDFSAIDGTALPDDLMIPLGPGNEPVPLRELKDRGLRLEDYTRKTQEVAEQRKANEKAVKLWDALQKEPLAVAKQLAVEAGLIDKDATPVRAVDFSTITSAEELEAEVEKRLEQALEEHPDVVEARRMRAMQTIEQEFDRIEGELDVQLNKKDREIVLREAKRRNVADLELVTQSLLSKRQQRAAERKSLKEAAPKRSTGQPHEEGRRQHADSFEEATEMALLELGITD